MFYTLFILFSFLVSSDGIVSISELNSDRSKRMVVIKEALQLLEAPYLYSGSSPRGFDCSGFTKYVYANSLGFSMPHSSYAQSRMGRKHQVKDCQTGDLIFFKRSKKINHVGLVLKKTKNELWVIHATSSKGVIKENVLKSTYWKNKIAYTVSLF